MKNRTIEKKFAIYGILIGFFAGVILTLILVAQPKENVETVTESKGITINQYKLKSDYGWRDIVLWAESQESFEIVYHDTLHKINYSMGFQRDPMCIDPIGGNSGNWIYEKTCFNFVWPPNVPNVLENIAMETRDKTLVIIGSIHNNGQNFYGDVYWY